MKLPVKDQELVNLLLSLKTDEEQIPNENEQSIVVICLTAHTNNKVDEFIELVKNNSDKTLQEIIKLIYQERAIDISFDENTED